MLVDGAQPAHTHGLPKLMEHSGCGQCVSQPGEAPPRGLFGQLCHEQIERMRGRQHRQQMCAPQLRRTQGVPPTAGKVARANLGNEIVGDVRTHQFKQAAGADRRQSQTHAGTLTQTRRHNTPLVSA
jgi:hypothetical protein